MQNKLFLKNIFLITISAFGGPQGHLLAISKILVEKDKFLTKEELMNNYAFCSFLPGATTTQLLCLIAYRRGGLKLLIPTLFIWILPSFLFLLSLSLLFIHRDIFDIAEDIFFLINPMVVAFIIYAAIRFNYRIKSSASNVFRIIVTVCSIIILFKYPFITPILFIINGLYSHYSQEGKLNVLDSSFIKMSTFNYRILLTYLLLFSAFAISSEYSRKFETKNRYYYNILEHNFRFGSFVYGGGDVLIPLMYEQYISRPSSVATQRRNPDALSISKPEFMTAAGVIRCIPGPVFTITAFTTPYLVPNFKTYEKVLASLIATISIFLPGILILLIFYPLWDKISKNNVFKNIISGINITVFSIMIASSIYLSYDLLFMESESLSIIIKNLIGVIFILSLLLFSKLTHSTIALLTIFAGLLSHFL